jgi:hypothetical protein
MGAKNCRVDVYGGDYECNAQRLALQFACGRAVLLDAVGGYLRKNVEVSGSAARMQLAQWLTNLNAEHACAGGGP